jgi:methionyl-tRNA formyltransferase
MGTPDFAVASLKKLVESQHKVLAVFTQPDKPVGRKHILTPPIVKVQAQELGIPVYQPQTLKDDEVYEDIKSLNPDVIVVVAYGKILPKRILDLPKFGCINVHGSLLPKYRGAAPIQWSVLNGDKYTGVTTMLMDVGLDTGDMLLKREVEIGENECAFELFDRLSDIGADLLLETLEKLDSITPEKQDESLATYASMIDKSLCPIDWNKSAREVHNLVRGLAQWPVAVTFIDGVKVKVHSGKIAEKTNCSAGEVVISDKRLVIACGDGLSYEISEIQPDGKRKMEASAFLLGNKLEVGRKIG